MKSVRLTPELLVHIPICSSKPPSCVKLKPMKLVYGKKLKDSAWKLARVVVKDEGMVMGAVCVGILAVVLSEEKALALGPEGPLVEEFWDNVRRYGLYALTVSTGALYTIFRPIVQLLKNPISAIFIIALFGGSLYIVSKVLSAMVGVSDFSYDFGY